MRKALVLIICIVFATNVNAQNWGNKLKNKVLKKVEQKAEQKADKAINSAIDKPVDKTEEKVKESVKKDKSKSNNNGASKEESTSGQASQEDMSKYLEMMGGGAVTLEDYPDIDEVEASDFVGSFDMETKMIKNGKVKDESTVSMYIDKYDLVIVTETGDNKSDPESRMIVNRKKGIMTILTNTGGNKMGMVMEMKTIVVDLDEVDQSNGMNEMDIQVFKNETKVINGYKCYKIEVSDDEYETTSWVTDEIDMDIQKVMSFTKMKGTEGKETIDSKYAGLTSWPIKTISKDKKSGEIYEMEMTNIKEGSIPASITSTDGYQLMKMPDMGNSMFGQ